MPSGKTLAALIATLLAVAAAAYGYALYDAAKGVQVRLADIKGVENLLRGSDSLLVVLNVSVPPEPLPVSICVDELHGNVMVNGELVARFRSDESFCIESGSWRLVYVKVSILKDELVAAILSSLASGYANISIEGDAVVPATVAGVELPVKTTVHFREVRRYTLSQVVESVLERVGRRVAEVAEKVASAVERVAREVGIAPGYHGEKRVTVHVEWLCGGSPCGTVKPGEPVEAIVSLQGYARHVVVKLRVDRRLLPDKTIEERVLPVLNGTAHVVFVFRAEGGAAIRGYFIEVDWDGGKWVMPFDERLRVG